MVIPWIKPASGRGVKTTFTAVISLYRPVSQSLLSESSDKHFDKTLAVPTTLFPVYGNLRLFRYHCYTQSLYLDVFIQLGNCTRLMLLPHGRPVGFEA